MTCPGCGRLVSSMANYIFVPAENRRYHEFCYRAEHPEKFNEEGESNERSTANG